MTNKNDLSTGFTLSPAQKAVVWLLGIALVAVFIASLTYRMSHPGNKVEFQQRGGGSSASAGSPGAMGESMSDESMKMVKELMERMKKEPDNMQVQLELANSFMMIRAYDRAQTFFEKVVSKEPQNVEALMGLGMCYYQGEKFPEAAASFEKILQTHPDDSMAMFNTAIIKKYYLHEHEAADDLLKQMIANPKTPADMKTRAEEELKVDPHAQ